MEATWTRREGTNPDLAYRLFPGEDLSGPAYVDTGMYVVCNNIGTYTKMESETLVIAQASYLACKKKSSRRSMALF